MVILVLASQLVPPSGVVLAAAHTAPRATPRNYLVHPLASGSSVTHAPMAPAIGALPDAPAAPTIPATTYTIGTDGWSGTSQTSDPIYGWGDDEWDLDFNQLMTISVNVVDCCIVGDNYAVYINNTEIGVTPSEPLNGSTFSQGTFTRIVAPGPHHIRIRDIGAITYYNQGATYMIPAEYSVTIQVSPASINRDILFVHGIGQYESHMDNPKQQDGFVPIFQALQAIYGAGSVTPFTYHDDRSLTDNGDPCPRTVFPDCQSQSSVWENAIDLAAKIRTLTAQTHHKITLIGYSMGGAIIRTVLAGCLPALKEQPACPGVASSVDSVFFIDSVQQGSWMAGSVPTFLLYPLSHDDLLSNMKLFIGWYGYKLVNAALRLNVYNPAETDLAPNSQNIQAYDSVPVPHGIAYYNFYGDIRLGAAIYFGPWKIPAKSTASIGDLVVLPGSDSVQQPLTQGGSEFCPGCTNHGLYRSSHPDARTSFTEWPLTDTQYFDLDSLLGCLPLLGPAMPITCVTAVGGSALSTALDVSHAPELHLNIPTSAALNKIAVKDTTGSAGGSSIVTIPVEIRLQLEQIDGIVP